MAFITRRQQEHQRTLMPSVASDTTKLRISAGEMQRDGEVQQPQTRDKEAA